jgi:acid phosphatase type 7
VAVRRTAPLALALALALPLLPAPSPARAADPEVRPVRAAKVVNVVAAGDIACRPGAPVTKTRCRYAGTARLVRRIDPDRILGLGDMSNSDGGHATFNQVYHPTWGPMRGITHPAPGNHDYETAGAAGYYRYFADQQPGPPGYYSRKYGSWRVYVLNSNCGEIDCEQQFRWLNRRLASDPLRCTIFTMHHPRFSSSGQEMGGRIPRFSRIAYRHRVEMVLGGHAHHYERFRKMNHRGERVKNGFIQFVVGTGGHSLRPFAEPVPGSAYRNDTAFGVLRLKLRPDSYKFRFRTVNDTVLDRGTRQCR